MREPCYKCKFEHKPIDQEPCEHCSDEYMKSGDHPAFQWAKSPSNADRVREMTDEELAEWLKNIRYSWTCLPRDNGNRCADFKDDCKACWLDWLKQEAE